MSTPTRAPNNTANGHILVVDDEIHLAQTYARYLRAGGFLVVTAFTVKEARERLAQGDVDLVLTDIIMPDGTGIDLLEGIATRDPTLAVVIMTGQPSQENTQAALRSGAVDYVTKPVHQEDLLQAARRGCEITRVRREKARVLERQLATEHRFNAFMNTAREHFQVLMDAQLSIENLLRASLPASSPHSTQMLALHQSTQRRFEALLTEMTGFRLDGGLPSLPQRHQVFELNSLVEWVATNHFPLLAPPPACRVWRQLASSENLPRLRGDIDKLVFAFTRILLHLQQDLHPGNNLYLQTRVANKTVEVYFGDDGPIRPMRLPTWANGADAARRSPDDPTPTAPASWDPLDLAWHFLEMNKVQVRCGTDQKQRIVLHFPETIQVVPPPVVRTSTGAEPGKPAIYVIDANDEMVLVVSRMLEPLRQPLRAFTSGLAALKEIENDSPGLILLDWHLGDISGENLLRNLRSDVASRNVPVIVFMSGRDLDPRRYLELQQRAFDLEAEDIIAKPLDPEDLRMRVQRVQRRHWSKGTLDSLQQMTNIADSRTAIEVVTEDWINAGELQKALRPHEPPATHGLEMATWLNPVRTLSGDFYDFGPGLHPGAISILIGDVIGKGISAYLFVVMIRSYFATMREQHLTPGQILGRMNAYLCREVPGMYMIGTALCLHLDPASGSCVVASAGHPFPMIIAADGGEKTVTSEAGGIPLGLNPEFAFAEFSFNLAPRDWMLLFTDGLFEARSPDGTMFLMRGLHETLQNTHHLTTAGALDVLKTRLLDYTHNLAHDDMAAILLRRSDGAS